MIVLGIHDGHGASACLMVDGVPRAMAAEERFSRRKNDYGYPRRAIDYCLAEAGLAPSDLHQVAFASRAFHAFYVKLKALCTFTAEDWIRLNKEYWRPKLYEGREDRRVLHELAADPRFQDLEHFYDLSGVGPDFDPARDGEQVRAIRLDAVRRHLGLDAGRVRFYDHHACHAHYALFGSPIRDDGTLVFTLDGGGDSTTSTLFRFTGGRLVELARSNRVDIARIYRGITHLLGMKLGEHEYKVMGLAPYATERELRKSYRVFDGMFTVRDNLIAYADGRRPPDLYFFFRDAFEGHRFDGIGAAVQRMVEVAVGDWVIACCRKYGARKAVFAGGVAMNIKLNMLLAGHPELDDYYVCPSPTDDTLPIGACYMAEAAAGDDAWAGLAPVDDVYLGPAFDRRAAVRALAPIAGDPAFRVVEEVDAERIADWLASGLVVARAVGRMEFGARALGNRSILADPRRPEIVEKINRQIKYRDFWMPFAPVVRAARAADYLVLPKPHTRIPYMMVGCATTARGRAELPAALHRADHSARPQILEPDRNPAYDAILAAFEARTGTGALVNTSFNLHGEPIVCSPEDAVDTFRRSELDALVLDGIAVLRARSEAAAQGGGTEA